MAGEEDQIVWAIYGSWQRSPLALPALETKAPALMLLPLSGLICPPVRHWLDPCTLCSFFAFFKKDISFRKLLVLFQLNDLPVAMMGSVDWWISQRWPRSSQPRDLLHGQDGNTHIDRSSEACNPHSKGIDSGLHCAAFYVCGDDWLRKQRTWKGDRSWLGANVMHHALEKRGGKGHFQASAFTNGWCSVLMFTLAWCQFGWNPCKLFVMPNSIRHAAEWRFGNPRWLPMEETLAEHFPALLHKNSSLYLTADGVACLLARSLDYSLRDFEVLLSVQGTSWHHSTLSRPDRLCETTPSWSH